MQFSNRRMVEGGMVEFSNRRMGEGVMVEFSNRRMVEDEIWWRCRAWWSGGFVESSNSGMVELSTRRMFE